MSTNKKRIAWVTSYPPYKKSACAGELHTLPTMGNIRDRNNRMAGTARPTGQRQVVFGAILIAVILAQPVFGLTYIRDVARPLGERTNKLIGEGIVVGLNGTGDGGDFLVTTRSLRSLLERLGSPASSLTELKNAKNAALVTVTAELGRNGVRNGDRIDVKVQSIGAAESLAGGTLFMTPLRSAYHNDNRLYAWAQGSITVGDPENPTSGIVKGGADVEWDFNHDYVDYESQPGRAFFTLVLDDDLASFEVTKAIAMIINEEMAAPGADLAGIAMDGGATTESIAQVQDAKNIRVLIPPKLARTPNNASLFIARILNLPVDLPDPQAAVVINEDAGTIVITGNVEIAPVLVHVPGLVIRVGNAQPGRGQTSAPEAQWTKFDTQKTGGVKIDELLKALNQLNVPVVDKINVLYAIKRAGALRANIIVTG